MVEVRPPEALLPLPQDQAHPLVPLLECPQALTLVVPQGEPLEVLVEVRA